MQTARLGLAIGLTVLAACGSGSGGDSGAASSSSGPSASTVSAPVTVNLYPVDQEPNNPARLFIFVTAVGSQAVRLPLAFDTGSAGISLNALAIFSGSIVTANGFVFAPGETAASQNGITVTNQQGTRSYGGPNGHTQIGNIGYATVTFGDSLSSLTTQVMPVFLYYAIRSNVTGQLVPMPTQEGWFGVNDAPNLITTGTGTTPYPACSRVSTGDCWVGSVLKYLGYTDVSAGFALSPLQVQVCDITSDGSCTPTAALTVGLDNALESTFSIAKLPCPPPTYGGPSDINGYPVCQEYVPGTTIAATGAASGSFTAGVIFDTGTPEFVFNVPGGTSFPAALAPGSSFQVTTPNGFVYSAKAGTGVFTVNVAQVTATTAGSVVGLGYFATNSLLVDFTNGMQGWK
jgi:hypothetical protein